MSKPTFRPRHRRPDPKHRAAVPVNTTPRNPFFTARHCAGDSTADPQCEHLHAIPVLERVNRMSAAAMDDALNKHLAGVTS